MPRIARVDHPGAVHHVMLRGIEQRPIFYSDLDRVDLFDRLSRLAPACGMECYAWAFMPNHVHLVVRTTSTPLSQFMARIGTGYAGAFNRRHERVGHLFQNRYKALPVVDDAQLSVLVRYVHLNPIRSGQVEHVRALEEYRWTGHSVLAGRQRASFQNTEAVLQLIDKDTNRARHTLRSWMVTALQDGGSSDPTAKVPEQLASLIARVCSVLGVAPEDLRSGDKRRALSRARAAVAYLALQGTDFTRSEIAGAIGVTRAAVRWSLPKGRALVRSDPALSRLTGSMRTPRPGSADASGTTRGREPVSDHRG